MLSVDFCSSQTTKLNVFLQTCIRFLKLTWCIKSHTSLDLSFLCFSFHLTCDYFFDNFFCVFCLFHTILPPSWNKYDDLIGIRAMQRFFRKLSNQRFFFQPVFTLLCQLGSICFLHFLDLNLWLYTDNYWLLGVTLKVREITIIRWRTSIAEMDLGICSWEIAQRKRENVSGRHFGTAAPMLSSKPVLSRQNSGVFGSFVKVLTLVRVLRNRRNETKPIICDQNISV